MKHVSRIRLRPKILAVVAVGLLGILTLALGRELTSTDRPVVTRLAARPPRPAFSPAEEAYIKALWPIHGDVERSTMRMSLGQIFYKTKDLGRAGFKKRVDEALVTYRLAGCGMLALEPPATLRAA